MNISITNKNKTEKTDNNEKIQLQQSDTEILANTNTPFAQILQGKINENGININEIDVDFKYDSLTMNFQDALFFINLAQNGQFSVQSAQNGEFQNLIKTEINQNIITQKTIDVSNQLTSLIKKAQGTQKPVRISFDNDISVILKIDKHGKVSAEFIPGSLEAESYLTNNISLLKQRFDEQNLPYTSLSNRNRNNKGNERRQEQNNRGDA